MTPDELRRLDNDTCIIFEKGIKPVKARKFYYFEHNMAKEMAEFKMSHNDIGEIDRGVWRKYNPYNPYVEEKDKQPVQDLKVESLDDLFDDDTLDELENSKLRENQPKNSQEELNAPILPQLEEDDNDYDLQKELEAKFDELFGPITADDE